MKSLVFAVIILAIAESGCTSTGTLAVAAASAGAPQEKLVGPALRSRVQDGIAVQVLTPRFSNETDSLPGVFVEVANRGDAPVDFSAANLAVYSGEAPVRIYTADELAKRIDDDFARATAAGGAKPKAWKMPAFLHELLTRSVPGKNAGVAPAATVGNASGEAEQAGEDFRAVRDRQLRGLRNLLTPSTLAPGGRTGGVVELHAEDLRNGRPLRLVVTLGGETQEFRFDVRQKGRLALW
ncbi:MAG TPA: hypothetical protein VL523_08170 [Terriglobia bacterium]|nr:hypothetical protein [Opitutaceae bacterium]HUI41928.1 hypothetical protein [Terriglobia bacterium]